MMDVMGATVAKIAAAAERSANITEDDFSRDGLLHCGNCGTPKQCRTEFNGKESVVYCDCKCRREEREAEREAARIRRLRRRCIPDSRLHGWTFANDDGSNPALTDKMRRYADNWPQLCRENIGLLLWGGNGTGKTFKAACVANALIDGGVSAAMTNFPRIINDLSGFDIEDKNGYIDGLSENKLLIIDDLGAERQSEFAQEIVYSVIDARYKSGKPLIVTTNLALDSLKNPPTLTCGRIYDRVLEMCVPIHFPGDSRRKTAYMNKIEKAKAVFA